MVRRAIASFLEAWADRGALSFEDSDQAGLDFSKLCEGDLYLRAQLGLLPPDPATEESPAPPSTPSRCSCAAPTAGK